MRYSLVLLLATGLCVSHALAQHEHHGQHGRAHKTATGVRLETRSDTGALTTTLRLGPLDLPARSDHRNVAQAPNLFWVVPFDGWLLGYRPSLVDDTGNAVPGRLLHHVAFWNARRSDLLCLNKQEHIFGAGGEMNEWPAVEGYGYRVTKGDRIRIETMFHNPTDTAYPKTYLEVRVAYSVREGPGPFPRNVYPIWFDVMGCRASGYDLRLGMNVTTEETTLPYSGTLLGVGGHLHDYGERLVLESVTRKEEIAALDAQLDPQGRILRMPVADFSERGGYHLNRGERVRVTSKYNNRTGKPLPEGAMGIVVGYFVPDNDAQVAALRRKVK